MKRTISVVAAVGLLIAISVPVAAATPGEGVYVSLGDSLAAGSQADAEGNTTFSSEQAYTDELHQRLKGRLVADLGHVKLGCPGETAAQLLGGVDKDGDPSNCADRYQTGSQIGDALAAIAQGNVVLITLDIGANDLFDARDTCGNDTACLGDEIAAITGRTAQIILTIREAGFAGPIVAMNFYNPLAAAAIGYFGGVAGQHAPDLQLALSSDALVSALNGAQGQVYAVLGVPVADIYDAFNAGDFGDDIPANGRPDNVDVLCSLSYMCPRDPTVKSNIHLNKQGYTVVAKKFVELIVG